MPKEIKIDINVVVGELATQIANLSKENAWLKAKLIALQNSAEVKVEGREDLINAE